MFRHENPTLHQSNLRTLICFICFFVHILKFCTAVNRERNILFICSRHSFRVLDTFFKKSRQIFCKMSVMKHLIARVKSDVISDEV